MFGKLLINDIPDIQFHGAVETQEGGNVDDFLSGWYIDMRKKVTGGFSRNCG